jgi:cation transport ATPase
MLLGFALLAVGIALAFFWSQEFFFAVKGALILGLMLLGLINVLVGLSKQKAKRDFAKAMQDEPGDGNQSATSDASVTSGPQV